MTTGVQDMLSTSQYVVKALKEYSMENLSPLILRFPVECGVFYTPGIYVVKSGLL